MKIKEVTTHKDKKEYNKLAKEYGNIFNTLEWLNIFGNKIKLFGIYEDSGKLVGGFYLYDKNKFGLRIYQNPLFTPCVGPFLQIEAENPVSIMSRWKKVLNLISKALENLPYSVISISLNRNIADTQPFIWRKFKVTPQYTYLLDLRETFENLQKEMSKERRNDINKAIKDNLEVKLMNDLTVVKMLVAKTFSRQNKKINTYYLDKILFGFANKNNSFAFITFNQTIPIAATFCIYDKNTAYYLLGGYDDKDKHHGAGALSIWESIKYAKSLGLEYFDFEGSMVPQIEKYFRGFGGKLTPYYRINKAKLLLEIFLKFFRRELF